MWPDHAGCNMGGSFFSAFAEAMHEQIACNTEWFICLLSCALIGLLVRSPLSQAMQGGADDMFRTDT